MVRGARYRNTSSPQRPDSPTLSACPAHFFATSIVHAPLGEVLWIWESLYKCRFVASFHHCLAFLEFEKGGSGNSISLALFLGSRPYFYQASLFDDGKELQYGDHSRQALHVANPLSRLAQKDPTPAGHRWKQGNRRGDSPGTRPRASW